MAYRRMGNISMACSHASYGLLHGACQGPAPAQSMGPDQATRHGASALQHRLPGCGCHPDLGVAQQNQWLQQIPC